MVGNPEDRFSQNEAHLIVCVAKQAVLCLNWLKNPKAVFSQEDQISHAITKDVKWNSPHPGGRKGGEGEAWTGVKETSLFGKCSLGAVL